MFHTDVNICNVLESMCELNVIRLKIKTQVMKFMVEKILYIFLLLRNDEQLMYIV